jgi:hypothetical protein
MLHKLCFALIALSFSVESSAEIDVAAFHKYAADDRLRPLLAAHVSGIGTGLEWYSSYLRSRNEKPIYCAPETLSLTVENDMQLLTAFIATHRLPDNIPLGLALLQAYVEAFPCKKD